MDLDELLAVMSAVIYGARLSRSAVEPFSVEVREASMMLSVREASRLWLLVLEHQALVSGEGSSGSGGE